MTRLFISYRRQDSAAWSGKLFDALASRYGVANVYLDIATIPAGRDFFQHVEAAVSNSDAVLAVIGPQWLEAAYRDDGRRRIDDPDDIVRLALRTALERKKRLVPVLVDHAHLPSADSLPQDIAPLADLQACHLRDANWNEDFAALVAELEPRRRSLLARLRDWGAS